MAVALQRDIINLARTLGWRVAHFPAVKTEHGWRTAVAADGKGFPDLIMVRERIMVVEVKEGGHRPRPEQAEWLDAFRLAGARAVVWTRVDWENGNVERSLRKDPSATWSMLGNY